MRILLVTPPMTQLNTPYPATAYLCGFLRQHAARLALDIAQADPALELFLSLYSRDGLTALADRIAARVAKRKSKRDAPPPAVAHFLDERDRYIATVEAVVRFLQGKDPSLALRIGGRDWLPEGPRFAAIDPALAEPGADPLGWAFGDLGLQDRAKYIASLYVDDLADAITHGEDEHFGLSRYGEKLAASATRYDGLADALAAPPTLVDDRLASITRALVERHRPDLLGLTVPFPGNVYGALRMAQTVRAIAPATRIALGGGYVNTELRGLREPRLFDLVDFVTLDDGEAPMLALLEHLRDPERPLLRTFVRDPDSRAVELRTTDTLHDIPSSAAGTPSYAGLPLDRYLSVVEMLNPMHRLWSDGRWNKITVAHGCYWKKCSFCDVTLDYIGRYDPVAADTLVDRIEAIVAETGQTGFHLVDEAAPPGGLKALAERLIARNVTITWWGNIRFEKTFTPQLCQLLARSGCVAVSGGLEVASDRLLALMKKGVTVEQVARVTRAFTDAGIMVHAYLMYGFPTETEQETVDSLERVRQLFEAGCLQSAFWHRFAATTHSPIGRDPQLFGIRLSRPKDVTFAENELPFSDPTGTDHDRLGAGLRKALYNYMHGMGLDVDVRRWFDGAGNKKVPAAKVPRDLVERALGA
ncbi:MAG TPA: radical SAM protein [Kofleriaceae bacterium]|nr:radical SAM protein [Kofleriaceae bacterium]